MSYHILRQKQLNDILFINVSLKQSMNKQKGMNFFQFVEDEIEASDDDDLDAEKL